MAPFDPHNRQALFTVHIPYEHAKFENLPRDTYAKQATGAYL